jgi:hypothetical protein
MLILQVVASQDWPEVTKYAGLVSAQSHRQELIEDLYKVTHDPQRGTICGGMIRYASISSSVSFFLQHQVIHVEGSHLQGAAYILQKINRSKTSETNIL